MDPFFIYQKVKGIKEERVGRRECELKIVRRRGRFKKKNRKKGGNSASNPFFISSLLLCYYLNVGFGSSEHGQKEERQHQRNKTALNK